MSEEPPAWATTTDAAAPLPVADVAALLDALRRDLVDAYDALMSDTPSPVVMQQALASIARRAAGHVWSEETGSRDAPPALELCLPAGHPHRIEPHRHTVE